MPGVVRGHQERAQHCKTVGYAPINECWSGCADRRIALFLDGECPVVMGVLRRYGPLGPLKQNERAKAGITSGHHQHPPSRPCAGAITSACWRCSDQAARQKAFSRFAGRDRDDVDVRGMQQADVMVRRNALGVPGAANDVKADNRKGGGAPKPGGSRFCRPQQLRRHLQFAQRLCLGTRWLSTIQLYLAADKHTQPCNAR